MSVSSALKPLWDTILKWMGDKVVAILGWAFAVGGPVATWLLSPAEYSISVTRLQGAGAVFALVAVTNPPAKPGAFKM